MIKCIIEHGFSSLKSNTTNHMSEHPANAKDELIKMSILIGSPIIAAKIMRNYPEEPYFEYEQTIYEEGGIVGRPIMYKDEDGNRRTCDYNMFLLYEGSTKEDEEKFMKKMDFEYQQYSYHQYIDGIVWFQDGSWAVRKQDKREDGLVERGNEWWEHRFKPEMPKKI